MTKLKRQLKLEDDPKFPDTSMIYIAIACYTFGGCSTLINSGASYHRMRWGVMWRRQASGAWNISWIAGFRTFGWWFQIVFIFTLGEDSHFDQYFSKGLKPPARHCFKHSNWFLPDFVCQKWGDMSLVYQFFPCQEIKLGAFWNP